MKLSKNGYYFLFSSLIFFGNFMYSSEQNLSTEDTINEQAVSKEEKIKKIKEIIKKIRELKKEIINFKGDTTLSINFEINKKLYDLTNRCVETIDEIYQYMDDAIDQEDYDELGYVVGFAQELFDKLLEKYQELKEEIQLQKAKEEKKEAESMVDRQKAEDVEQKTRKELEQSFEQEIQTLMALMQQSQQEIISKQQAAKKAIEELSKAQTQEEKVVGKEKVKAAERDLKEAQAQQKDMKEQQEDIKKQLKSLENRSVTKEFMDYVENNASEWFKQLPGTKIVTLNSVEKIVQKENFTKSEVLYINGFLQAMKL